MSRLVLFHTEGNDFLLDISIFYLAPTTTTTTPAFCATTCTGNLTTNSDITTCGRSCVDTGGYRCQAASTYCASGTFASGGYCLGTTCPVGFCCVFDTFISSKPFLCIKCLTS